MSMPRGGTPGRGRRGILPAGRPVPRHGGRNRARRGEPGRVRRDRKRRDRSGRPGRIETGPKLRLAQRRRVRVRRRRFGFLTGTRKWHSAWAPGTGRMAGTRRPAWISTHSANGDGCSEEGRMFHARGGRGAQRTYLHWGRERRGGGTGGRRRKRDATEEIAGLLARQTTDNPVGRNGRWARRRWRSRSQQAIEPTLHLSGEDISRRRFDILSQTHALHCRWLAQQNDISIR